VWKEIEILSGERLVLRAYIYVPIYIIANLRECKVEKAYKKKSFHRERANDATEQLS